MRAPLRTAFIVTAVLAISLPAMAKVNPLRVITEKRIRPEILIVLDTSGSMAWYPNPSTTVGTDCGGTRKGSVDLCGDGLCSGNEGSSSNSCLADCNITSNSTTKAGSTPQCNKSAAKTSRMFMVKRVLRNLLPEVRKTASLGLVTFKQTGYYTYYPEDPSGQTVCNWVWETYYVTEKDWVCKWVWQTVMVNKKFKECKIVKIKRWHKKKKWVYRNRKVCKNVWKLVPVKKKVKKCGWVYTQVEKKKQVKKCTTIPGGVTKPVTIFLSKTEMEHLGAWDATDEAPDATFTRHGVTYTLLSGTGLTVNKDSLYVRTDDLTVENRFKFADAGESYSDGTYSWKFKGSFYTYNQRPVRYNYTPQKLSTYKGPMYQDSSGKFWIYNRFNADYKSQGINAYSSGLVRENFTSSEKQADIDAVLSRIVARLNTATNGGIYAWGGTPTGPAIYTARSHFYERHTGTGAFKNYGIDAARNCRPRYVLLLTDGQSNQGTSPITAARDLYKYSTFKNNPVQTLVVGLPGLPSSAVTELDRIADMGDDGKANNSKTAYTAGNESALVKVLQSALLEMLQGDYTTTAPGIATSGGSYINNDTALVPSTEYPKWRGHFRSMDLTQSPPTENWDAAKKLNLMSYKDRILFTGFPASNSGNPIPLFKNGDVNVGAIRSVWSQSGTPPSDNEIKTVVNWLAGKDKDWKLGPVFRSAPATVAMPPVYNIPGHGLYRTTKMNRESLIYITSNDGLLHAFRTKDGTEAFGYVPPTLWPQIFKLWKQGGQRAEPEHFQWLLGASPRVEDVPPTNSPQAWATHLMLTMGPGGEDFVTLDVTTPSTCTAITCKLNDPPFRIVAHSKELFMDSTLGETWSTPVYYYGSVSKYEIKSEAAMASGYGTNNEGSYFNRLGSLYGNKGAALHPGTGAKVDYAVLADTAAAVNYNNNRVIIATYQADLRGRLVRYDEGNPNSGKVMLDAGSLGPFYFSPALLHRGEKKNIIAAATGSDREEAPAAGSESTLYLRYEDNGFVQLDQDFMSCKVSDICSGVGSCPTEVPASCSAPSSRAKPTGPPLLFDNDPAPAQPQVEVFYLLYDPPVDVCSEGDSWLIRISTTGDTQKLISAKKFAGVRATGMSVVGGGLDLAIATVGKGKNSSNVFTVSDALNTYEGTGELPVVEVWKEVRNQSQNQSQ